MFIFAVLQMPHAVDSLDVKCFISLCDLVSLCNMVGGVKELTLCEQCEVINDRADARLIMVSATAIWQAQYINFNNLIIIHVE